MRQSKFPGETRPISMPRPAAPEQAAPKRDISTRAAIVLFFAVGVLLYLAWYLREALLLIYFSIMVAVVLTPSVGWVGRLRIGRWHPGKGVGVLLLALVFAGALAVF